MKYLVLMSLVLGSAISHADELLTMSIYREDGKLSQTDDIYVFVLAAEKSKERYESKTHIQFPGQFQIPVLSSKHVIVRDMNDHSLPTDILSVRRATGVEETYSPSSTRSGNIYEIDL